jgi:hypothetical protein
VAKQHMTTCSAMLASMPAYTGVVGAANLHAALTAEPSLSAAGCNAQQLFRHHAVSSKGRRRGGADISGTAGTHVRMALTVLR